MILICHYFEICRLVLAIFYNVLLVLLVIIVLLLVSLHQVALVQLGTRVLSMVRRYHFLQAIYVLLDIFVPRAQLQPLLVPSELLAIAQDYNRFLAVAGEYSILFDLLDLLSHFYIMLLAALLVASVHPLLQPLMQGPVQPVTTVQTDLLLLLLRIKQEATLRVAYVVSVTTVL